MTFFIIIHRSIVQSRFFKEARGYSWGEVARFLAKMFFLAAWIAGLSHTYYIFDIQKGIPALVSEALPKMQIENGRFYSDTTMPFIPNKVYVEEIFSLLFNLPRDYLTLPDSFLVVDTSGAIVSAKSSSIWVVLTSQYVVLYANIPSLMMSLPYTFFVGTRNVTFTSHGIYDVLKKLFLFIAFYFIVQDGIITIFSISFGIFFIALAAYIFRREWRLRFIDYLKISSFACSPLFLAICMNNIAGTRFQWVGQVGLFLSAINMFRAMKSVEKELVKPEQ